MTSLAPMTANAPVTARADPDFAALGCAGILLGYACLTPWLRDFGPAGLVLPTIATAFLALVYARRYIQLSLVLLAALGLMFIAMSWGGLLHRGLTLLFEREAILQQAYYTVFLVVLVPACAHIWSQIEDDAPGWHALETFALLLACGTKIALTVLDLRLSDIGGIGLSQLINPDAVAILIIARRYLFGPSQPLALRIAIGAALVVTAGSMQSTLMLAALIMIAVFPQFAKGIAAGAVIALFAVAIGAQPFVRDIWWWDYNTGVRLLFWQDVYDRFIASGTWGVGFGTETIRPVYQVGIEEHVISGLDRAGYIHVSAHNAYVDAFYRMGLIGGILVLFYFLSLFARICAPHRPSLPFDCWVVCILAVSLMVNVALASVGFIFGSGLLAGWLVYRLHEQDRADEPVLHGGTQDG